MKRVVAAILIVFAITSNFITYTDAAANQRQFPPQPWELVFEDAGRILYMTPQSQSEIIHRFLIEDYGEERMAIRSGLYYNTTPPQVIYYTDRFFYEDTVFFSNCGMYFALLITTPSANVIHGDVIWFYERGVLIRSYRAEELLSDPVRIARVNGWWLWIRQNSIEHNKSGNTLSLTTTDNRAYVFDITTGEIISMEYNSGPSTRTIIATAVITLLIIIICIQLAHKRKEG